MPLTFIALVLASSLDRPLLQSVMKRATPGFKRCYVDALKERPELAGKARMTLTISDRGTVEAFELEFPVDAPHFTQCLRVAAMKLRFPEGPATYKVIWPVLFQGS